MAVTGNEPAQRLWIRLLGPVIVVTGSRPLALPRHRQRSLFALLALHAGETIGIDHIVDGVWGADPPRQVRNQIHVQVSGLRTLLARAGCGRALLTTETSGYRLGLPPGTRDIDELATLVRLGRRERDAGALDRAGLALQSALDLWHGPALGGVDAAFARAAADLFEERRLAVLSDLADVTLAGARPAELVPRLAAEVLAHPLHEGLRLRLMLALVRSGRRAEALSVYRDGRRIMVAELGLEPGPALRQAEASILRGEPLADSLAG